MNNINSNNDNNNGVNNQKVINNVARVIPVDNTNKQVINEQPKPSNDNIVTPTMVDLSKVQVNNDDTMINRERDNIVSATIQANRAIDKDKAKDVNNQIKVKKFSKTQIILIVILVAIIACISAFLVVKLVNKMVNYGVEDKTTTTTTTQSIFQKELSYFTNTSIIRKYQDINYILLLSPSNIDLKDNKTFYMYLKYDNTGTLEEESGTYIIEDTKLELTSRNDVKKEFELTEVGLVSKGITLKKNNGEMKSYKYETDSIKKILIINGTVNNELGLWIKSTKDNTTYELGKIEENDTSIIFATTNIFSKSGENIINNNETYQYVE